MINKVNACILLFGTPDFALPALEGLVKNGYTIAGVVTRPDEPVGRGSIITPPPVKVLAEKYNLPIFQPERLDVSFFRHSESFDFAQDKLREESRQVTGSLATTRDDHNSLIIDAELFIVAAYGKIIPNEILKIPQYGVLNIHPSLLPKWRGASPIQSAILNGDSETGVSIIKLDEQMDHGPIVAQEVIPLAPDSTYPKLHDELAKIGAKLLIESLPKYLSGEIKPTPQDDNHATFCKQFRKDDGRVNWSRPAIEIERMVRALNPWPSVWTLWPAQKQIYRVRIDEAAIVQDEDPAQSSAGHIWQSAEYPLLVKTGSGSIAIIRATIEGKKSLTAADLVRGYPHIIGATFV